MDSDKIRAMLEWVNALNVCETKVRQLQDFRDGRYFLNVLNAVCCKDDKENIPEPELGTPLGRFCQVEEFLQGFYQTPEALSAYVDLEAVINGSDIETAKVLLLLLAAAVQHKDREHFVETAMSLDLNLQAEIKEILEPLLMEEGKSVPTIPKGYASILVMKRRSERSPVRQQRSVVRALMQSPGMGNTSFTNSPLTPIKALVQSPQMAYKLRIRETEKKNRNLEKDLSEERHLKSELEWVIQEKKQALQMQEKKIRDLERTVQQHQLCQDQLDEMEALRSDKEKMAAECSRLKTKLQEYQSSKTMNCRLEKENKVLYAEMHELKIQLKSNENAKEEHTAYKLRNTYLEEKAADLEFKMTSLEEMNAKLTNLFQNERSELEKVREIHREKMKEMRERLDSEFHGKDTNSPCGETMTVVTQTRVFELEAELMEMKSSWIDPQVYRSLEEKYKKVNESKQSAEGAVVEIKGQVLNLETKVSHLSSRCSDYQEQISELASAKQVAIDQMEAQAKTIHHLQEHEVMLVQAQRSLEAEKARLKEGCETLTNELENTSETLKLATKEKDAEKTSCETLRETLKKSQDESLEQRRQLEKRYEEVKEKLNSKIKEMQNEILGIKEEKCTTEQNLRDQLSVESETCKKLDQKIQELAMQFKDVCCKRSELLNQVDELREEIGKEERANVSLGQELAVVKDQLESSKETCEKQEKSLQEGLLERSNLCQRLERVNKELEEEKKYVAELRERSTMMQTNMCDSEKDKNNLVVRIEQVTTDLAAVRTEKVELEFELRQSRDAEGKLKEKLGAMHEDMKSREEELKKDLLGYETAIAKLNATFENEMASMEKVKADLHEQRKIEMDNYKQEMEQLQDDLVVERERNGVLDEKWTAARNQITKLEEELEESQAKANREIGSLESQVDTFKNKLAELKTVATNQVSNLEQRMKTLESESNQQIAELESKVSESEALIEDLKGESSRQKLVADEKLAETQVALNEERSKCSSLEADVTKFTSELQEIRYQADDQNKLLATMETALKDASEELASVKEQVATKDGVISAEKETCLALESEVAKVQELLQQSQEDVAEREAVILSRDEMLRGLEDKLQSTEENVAELQAKVSENEANIASKEEFILNLEESLEEVKEELETAKESFANREAALAAVGETLDSIKSNMEKVQAEAMEARTQLALKDEVIAAADNKVQMLEGVVAEVKENLAEAHKTISLNDTELKSKDEKIREIEENLSEINTDWQQAKELIEKRDAELASQAETLEEKCQTLENVYAELSTVNAQIASQEDELAGLKEKVSGKERKLVRFSEELASTQELVFAKDADIAYGEDRFRDLEISSAEQIRDLQQSLQAVKCGADESTQRIIDLQTALDQTRSEAEQTRSDLKQQLALAEEQNKEKTSELEEQVEAASLFADQKEKALSDLELVKNDLDQRIAEITDELAKARCDIEQTVMSYEAKLEEVKSELQSRSVELDEQKNQRETVEKALASLQEESAESQAQAENKFKELEDELQRLTEEKDRLIESEKNLHESQAWSAERIKDLEEVVKRRDDEVDRLLDVERDLSDLGLAERDSHAKIVEELKEEVSTLKDDLEKSENVIREKEEVIGKRDDEIDRLLDVEKDLSDLGLAERDSHAKIVEEFTEQVSTLKKDLEKSENVIREKEEVVRKRDDEVDRLLDVERDLSDLALAERDSHAKIVEEFTEQVSALKEDLERSENVIREKEEVVRKRDDEVDRLLDVERDLSDLALAERDSHAKIVEEYTEQVSALKKDLERSENVIREKEEVVRKRDDEVDRLLDVERDLSDLALAERDSHAKIVEEFTEQVSALKEDLEKSENVIREKEETHSAELQELLQQKENLQQTVAEKDSVILEITWAKGEEIEQLISEKRELEIRVNESQAQSEVLSSVTEQEIKDLKTVLQSVVAANEQKVKELCEEREKEVEVLVREKTDLESALVEKDGKIEDLMSGVSSVAEKNGDLETRLTEVTKQLLETEERETSTKVSLEEQTNLVEESRKEIEALKEEVTTARREFNQEVEKQKLESQSQIQEYAEKLEAMQLEVKEKESLLHQEMESKDQLQTRVLQLQFDHEVAKKQHSEAQRAHNDVQKLQVGMSEEIQKNKETLEGLRTKVQEYEFKVSQLAEENQALKTRETSLATELEQVKEQSEEKIDMISENVKHQMTREREIYTERITELEQELKEELAKKNCLRTVNHEKEKLVVEMQGKLSNSDVKYERLERKFQTQIEREEKLLADKEHEMRLAEDMNRSLRAQLEAEKEKFHAEVEDIMKQNEVLLAEKANLEDINTEQTNQLRKEQLQISELEEKTEKLSEYIWKLKNEKKLFVEDQEKSHGMFEKELHRLQDTLDHEIDLKEKYVRWYQKEEVESRELRDRLAVAQAKNMGLHSKSPSRSVLSLKSPVSCRSPEISAIRMTGKSPRVFDDSLEFMDDSGELTADDLLSTCSARHDKENRSPDGRSPRSRPLSMSMMSHHYSPRPLNGLIQRHSPSQRSIGNYTMNAGHSLGEPMNSLFTCDDEPDPEERWDRLTELARRNSLCLPHMKSSYPVETQARNPTHMPDDMIKSLPIPNSSSKYEGTTRRKSSPSDKSVVREEMPETNSALSSSIYSSCHRTLPSSFKVPKSVPIKSDRSRSYDSSTKKSLTPQKGGKESRRTPHKKHHKTPGSGKKSKGAKQPLIDENNPVDMDSRENMAFSIPITPNKKKSKGLMKRFMSDKKEPPQSPKLRKPLHARNFLLFGQ